MILLKLNGLIIIPYAHEAYGNIKSVYSPLNCQPRSKIDLWLAIKRYRIAKIESLIIVDICHKRLFFHLC